MYKFTTARIVLSHLYIFINRVSVAVSRFALRGGYCFEWGHSGTTVLSFDLHLGS